jgi:hypothetical protein
MMKQNMNLAAWYASKLFDHPYCKIPPLLVSGVGRSGTTALRMSLGLHPDIEYNGAENNIVMDILETGVHNCTYPSRKASMQMSQEKYDKVFRNLILAVLFPRPAVFRIMPGYWMALSDLNPRLAGYFRQLFPTVRIVYTVRNGIEVVSSRMVFDGFRKHPFDSQCEVWAKAEDMAKWGREQDNFFLIRHEMLVDKETALQVFTDLWSWLGLRNEHKCIDALWSSSYHPTKFPGEDPRTSADLRSRSLRWEFWTDDQRREFTIQCAPAMEFFGYEIPWLRRTRG